MNSQELWDAPVDTIVQMKNGCKFIKSEEDKFYGIWSRDDYWVHYCNKEPRNKSCPHYNDWIKFTSEDIARKHVHLYVTMPEPIAVDF
jgi:hypothetical protein